MWISPVQYNHSLLGPVYSAPAHWYFTQWDAAEPLVPGEIGDGCPFVKDDNYPVWGAASASRAVCLEKLSSPVGFGLLVAMNGSMLQCGNEYDMFIAPTDSAYNNEGTPNLQPTTNLAQLPNLQAEFTLAFLSASVTPRCGAENQCGPSGHVDYAYITLGIVLSAGDETIFYQVILADTRNRATCPANDPCEAFEYWFEDTLPTLGYSESIANSFGMPCLQPGTQQSYQLPILPRLKYAVSFAAEHFGSTADLASWYITGVYLGPGMEGSAVVSVRMSGLDLNYN